MIENAKFDYHKAIVKIELNRKARIRNVTKKVACINFAQHVSASTNYNSQIAYNIVYYSIVTNARI